VSCHQKADFFVIAISVPIFKVARLFSENPGCRPYLLKIRRAAVPSNGFTRLSPAAIRLAGAAIRFANTPRPPLCGDKTQIYRKKAWRQWSFSSIIRNQQMLRLLVISIHKADQVFFIKHAYIQTIVIVQ
jgi:hypothetical protein